MIHTHCTSHRAKRTVLGNALVEFGLVAPILFVLMLAMFDTGIYIFAFISVADAARAAAIHNSGGTEGAADQSSACTIATNQLRGLPAVNPSGSCTSAPLVVSSTLCSGSAACGSASTSADGNASTLVTVTYTLPSLFQVPFAGSTAISISSQMRLRNSE